MADLYARQSELGLYQPTVMVVGCGGVGCWVALSLALGGASELVLFDGDVLDTHNLNRFPLPLSEVGQSKSVALAKWLATLRPEIQITARGEFNPLLHGLYVNYLVCATDSLKSRKMCYEYARSRGIDYLEVGADGERWSLSPKPPEFSTELEAEPGYQTVPVHVGPCMMAGAAAAYYVLHMHEPDRSHLGEWNSEFNKRGLVLATMSEVGEEEVKENIGEYEGPFEEDVEEEENETPVDLTIPIITREDVVVIVGEPDPNPFGPEAPNTLGAQRRQEAAIEREEDEPQRP